MVVDFGAAGRVGATERVGFVGLRLRNLFNQYNPRVATAAPATKGAAPSPALDVGPAKSGVSTPTEGGSIGLKFGEGSVTGSV